MAVGTRFRYSDRWLSLLSVTMRDHDRGALEGRDRQIEDYVSEAAAELAAHEAATTNVHGIADTSLLVTLAGVQVLTNKTLSSFTNTVDADHVHIQARNVSGVDLDAGTAVRITGYNPGQELVTVDLADASSSATMPSIGLTEAAIANNSNGAVIMLGRITGADTSAWAVGDVLYVSETPGVPTNVIPVAPAVIQHIGTVLRSHASQGVILIAAEGPQATMLGSLSGYVKGNGAGVYSGVATIPATDGGTGQTAYAVGDLLYGTAANTLSKLASVATGNALIAGGVGVAPSWGKIGLTTHVSGTLAVGNGGTNLTTYTTGDLLYASAANTLSKLVSVATGNALIAGGVGVAPSWGKIELTTHVSGTLAVGNGGTGATTHTSGNFLLGAGAGAITSQAGITYANITAVAATSYSPTLTNVTLGNGTRTAAHITLGKLCFFRCRFTLGTTSAITGLIQVNYPAASATPTNVYVGKFFDTSAGTVVMAFPQEVSAPTGVDLYAANSAGTYVVRTATSSTVPFTWATGDYFEVAGVLTLA